MTTDTMNDDARDLQRALTDLVRVYQFRDRDTVCCYDVSPGQSHALERLAAHGPMTLNEFAASLFLEKSSASRLVDGLQRKGYVKREVHPDNGRALQVSLTARGRVLFEKIERDLIQERRQVLTGLGPEERRVLIRSIAKLADIAASGVDSSGGVCTRTSA